MTPRTSIRIGLGILICLIPLIVGPGMIRLVHGKSLTDQVYAGTDQVMYWHQTATLLRAGMNGGYYTNFEMPPDIELGRAQLWGPFVSWFYVPIGLVFGWEYYTMPIANMVLFAIGGLFFMWVLRPSLEELLLMAVVTLTAHSILLFSAIKMTELLNYSVGLIIALIFIVLLRHNREDAAPLPLWQKTLMGLYLIMIALSFRITWGFLLFPFALLVIEQIDWKRALIALTIAFAVLMFLYFLRSLLWVDYPTLVRHERILAALRVSVEEAYVLWRGQTWHNFQGVRSPPFINQLLYIQLFVVVMALSVFYLLKRDDTLTLAEIGFHIFNLVSIFLFGLLIHYLVDWRGYRVIIVHLFVTQLVLAFSGRRWLSIALVALSLLGVPEIFSLHSSLFNTTYVYDELQPQIEQIQAELSEHVVYDENVPSPWCNTILFDWAIFLGENRMAVPPGIGISQIFDAPEADLDYDTFFPRSRYLWMDDYMYSLIENNGNARQVAVVNGTPLYINEDADCDP